MRITNIAISPPFNALGNNESESKWKTSSNNHKTQVHLSSRLIISTVNSKRRLQQDYLNNVDDDWV